MDSRLTYYLKGVWIANVVLVKDEIKEDNLNPDTLTFISDNITLIIKSNYINNKYLGELPLPENLKIVYDDLLKMYDTIKRDYENGNFNGQDGKSAYEIAVQNGFEGTENEWLASLDYEHSEEFEQLAEQVKNDAKKSASNASTASAAAQSAATNAGAALNSANAASQSAADASVSATQAQQAAQEAENSKTSAETASSNAQQSAQSAEENANKAQEIADSLDPTLFAIKETTTGNPTIISDSAEWRLQKLGIYGQSVQANTTGAQLFDILKATPRTNTFGLTVTIDGDYILINGSVENLNRKDFRIINTDVSFEGKICKAFDVTTTNCSIVNLVPSVGESNIVIHLNVTALENISCKFKLMVSDTEPTSYEPYTGGKPSPSPDYPQGIISKEVSEIKVTGKNLANIQEFEAIGISGFEAQYEDDKIVYSGANDWAGCGVVLSQTFEAGQYTIKAKNVAILISDVKIVGFSDVAYWENLGYPYWMKNFYNKTEGYTFYSDKPFKIGFIGGTKTGGVTDAEGTMEQIQIELSSEATSYEQYKEQKITLSEPIILRGVHVFSGGNVTINGQQYISDVIKEKDGVIGVLKANDEIIVDGTNLKFSADKNNEYWNLTFRSAPNLLGNPVINLSNYFPKDFFGTNETYSFIFIYVFKIGDYFSDINEINEWIVQKKLEGNPLKIQYLVNPTFEPLPEEVQAQYKALKSYYSNTVIQTGCWNEVTYVADTKTWIENKLSGVTELALGIGGK